MTSSTHEPSGSECEAARVGELALGQPLSEHHHDAAGPAERTLTEPGPIFYRSTMPNDLALVISITDRLRVYGLDVWLAGGWAEELHGMIEPRPHHDVDLLVRADSFETVDRFLSQDGIDEIEEKRFAHKRAFQVDGIMVELILVRRVSQNPRGTCAVLPQTPDRIAQPLQVSSELLTTFWGQHEYVWPADSFHDESGAPRLVSVAALRHYRNNRPPTRSIDPQAAT